MAPRKPVKPQIPSDILIIDNGAYNIKAGYAPPSSSFPSLSSQIDLKDCHVIPNCLARLPSSKNTLVGAQLRQCRDFAEMAFRRPVQRGQLVNWESEREIWCTSFFDVDGGSAATGLVVPCADPRETSLLLTEAPNSFTQLQSNADQVIFEEFEFGAYRRVPGPVMSAYADLAGIFGDRKDPTTASANEVSGEEKMDTDQANEAGSNTTTTENPPPNPALAPATPTAPLGHGLATSECVLVVDAGYSHTTVTPLWRGRPIQQAVRRLEVGGKLLTNHLKETLSVRQLDLTHEFHIVNEMKEDLCFVTTDLRGDLERTWKHGPKYEPKVKLQQRQQQQQQEEEDTGMDLDDAAPDLTAVTNAPDDAGAPLGGDEVDPYAKGIVLDYVMPDYTTRFRGSVRAHDPAAQKLAAKLRRLGSDGGGGGGGAGGAGPSAQDTVVTLGNERFMTPECLFSPRDVIGLQQAGLAGVVMQSVRAMPPGLWPAMLANVLVVGGTARLPGFVARLRADLRPLVPVEIPLRVRLAPRDPEKATWEGAARLAAGARDKRLLKDLFVTRQEYQEHGEGWVMRQFAGERPLPW